MTIVHASRGFERTSGISLFVSKIISNQIDAGHECVLFYQLRLEHEVDSRAKVVQGRGNLNVIGGLPDVVHVHAVWTMFSVRVMRWCRQHKIPYVVSPHGCLMPWVLRNGWLKKHLFYEFLLKRSLLKAGAVHVTSMVEREAIGRLHIDRHAVILPLGVDFPDSVHQRSGNDVGHSFLFMSRLSPEKGLENLLEAWSVMDHKDWRLILAGPDWMGYGERLKNLVGERDIADVVFTGAVYGDAKDSLYQSADCFVLPSFTENFSAVVADALAYGIPVITTKGTPWKVIEDIKCGCWIDIGVDPLAKAMSDIMAMSDEERGAMGARGRVYAKDAFNWKNIANALIGEYQNVISSGGRSDEER